VATVFATLAPSVAAFHLAFDARGDLYVTNPSMSGYDAIHRITPDGEVQTFFGDLGRPQGLAFDSHGHLYVVAHYRGDAGIIEIPPQGEARHVVSGVNLVGLAGTHDCRQYIRGIQAQSCGLGAIATIVRGTTCEQRFADDASDEDRHGGL
jgi:sugar lactone lactonase YvrE